MIPLGSGELVHVGPKRQGAFPMEFTWRGQRHRIREFESYDVADGQLHSPGGLRRMKLRTTGGMRCTLVEDPSRGTWRIERVIPRFRGGRS